MIEDRQEMPRIRRGCGAWAFGALTLALAVCIASAATQAAGPSGPSPAPELRALLATNTNVLSESAMARQKGAGLRPPAFIMNEPNGPPRVLLWDEMRIAPLIAPPADGVVTGGGGTR